MWDQMSKLWPQKGLATLACVRIADFHVLMILNISNNRRFSQWYYIFKDFATYLKQRASFETIGEPSVWCLVPIQSWKWTVSGMELTSLYFVERRNSVYLYQQICKWLQNTSFL